MMTLQTSERKDKRFKAVFDNKKTVHFGSNGKAYIDHNDDDKKTAYLARHKANEDWDAPMTAGALSRWLLWNEKTLEKSVKDYSKRFNIKNILIH